jgi:hypothetical protein
MNGYVSEQQVEFHRFWEAASLFVQLPFMVYLGTRQQLPIWARVGAWAMAGLIVYVDGGLLLRWQALEQGAER